MLFAPFHIEREFRDRAIAGVHGEEVVARRIEDEGPWLARPIPVPAPPVASATPVAGFAERFYL